MKVKLQKISSVFFILIALFSAPANAQPPTETSATVNQVIETFMHKYKVPGVAVEVYVNGVPHSYYYGYANLQQKTKVTQNTLFELGSITKLFTSLLLANERNAGIMRLDSPVTHFLEPALHYSELKYIKLKNLATHTAGLPFDMPENITVTAANNYFLHWQPGHPINTSWSYSNVGFGLLGYALESAAHQTYDQLDIEDILQPLGMNAIATTVPDYLMKDYAQGYGVYDASIHKVDMRLFPAAGSMVATGHDLLLFLKAAIGLPGTPAALLQEMRLTQTPIVRTSILLQGLGWQIWPIVSTGSIPPLLHEPQSLDTTETLAAQQLNRNQRGFDPYALIDKSGATAGFRSYIAVIPSRKTGIVILANRAVPIPAIVATGREILFKLNGLV